MTILCTAFGGDKDGDCIFPFEYKGTLHNKCGDFDNSGKEWCATKVNSNNELDKWGYCDCGCPMTSIATACTASGGDKDGPCIFPFEHRGTMHNKCTDHDSSSREWCATSVKGNGQWDKWGYCGCGCYAATTTTTTTAAPTITTTTTSQTGNNGNIMKFVRI